MSKTRLYGVAVAFVIAAAIASLLTATGGAQPGDPLVADWADCVLAACLAALMLSTRVHGRWPDGVGDVLAMAVVTYVIGVLLFPIVQSVAAWPAASTAMRHGVR